MEDDITYTPVYNAKRVDELSAGETASFMSFTYDEKWEYTDDNNIKYNVYYRDGVPVQTQYANGFKTNMSVVKDSRLISALANVSEARSAQNLPTASYASASIIEPNSSYTSVQKGTLIENHDSSYDEIWNVQGKDGKKYTVYYKDGKPVSASNGGLFFTDTPKKTELYSLVEEIRNNGENTTFGKMAFALSTPKKERVTVNDTSFEIDNNQVEEVCTHMETISSNASADISECVSNFFQVANDFLAKVGGGNVEQPGYPLINVIDAIDELRGDLASVQEALNSYARGDSSKMDSVEKFLNPDVATKDDSDDSDITEDLNPDFGPYIPEYSNDSNPSTPDNSQDTSDVKTDIDTDIDVKPVTPDDDIISDISASIPGAAIGSTILGMATGAAGVAGAGALIGGDSVLDEINDDTLIVPSIVRNSTANTLKKTKKNTVGVAVGVGLGAAAVGGGLYYYSKKSTASDDNVEEYNGDGIYTDSDFVDDSNKKDEYAEVGLIEDDNEDGAVEFQYLNGLGNVVELRDAILNDTLN